DGGWLRRTAGGRDRPLPELTEPAPRRPCISAEVSSMRFSGALVAVALALAGCAAAKQPPAAPPPLHVYALSGDQVGVDDLQGNLERLLPAGIPAPDWSLLYVTTPAGVQAVHTRTGVVVRSLALEGAYAMPRPNLAGLPQGLSPDGHWL